MKKRIKIEPIPAPVFDECADWFKDQIITFPTSIMCVGSSRAGKTTQTVNLIMSPTSRVLEFFSPENIYIFASNGNSDHVIRFLIDKLEAMLPGWQDENYGEEIDVEFLEDLWKE